MDSLKTDAHCSLNTGKKDKLSTLHLAASYFPCSPSLVAGGREKDGGTDKGRRSVERGSCAGHEIITVENEDFKTEKRPLNLNQTFQYRRDGGSSPHSTSLRSEAGVTQLNRFVPPDRPFVDSDMVNSPFAYLPDAVRDQWLQMFSAINSQPSLPHRSLASSSTDEFDHNYKFQNHLAKAADERSKKHVKNLHKCVRNLVQMMGALEATHTTIRGCFYGSLCALEYGSHCWTLLRGFSIVRLLVGILTTFWRYVKYFGQKAPLVGLLALLCTYVGRACVPVIRRLLSGASGRPPCLPADIRRVKISYKALKPDELSVSVGEQVVIGRREQNERLPNTGRVYVKRLRKTLSGKQVGFISHEVLENE